MTDEMFLFFMTLRITSAAPTRTVKSDVYIVKKAREVTLNISTASMNDFRICVNLCTKTIGIVCICD